MHKTCKEEATLRLEVLSYLKPLIHNRHAFVTGYLQGIAFEAELIIPDYAENIVQYYSEFSPVELSELAIYFSLNTPFLSMGVRLRFEQPVHLSLHTKDMLLYPEVQKLVRLFGPVILQNAILDDCGSDNEHKAIFADLRFHRDRGDGLDRQYSLYYRDPFDPEQALPRTSSTVFMSNMAVYLQYQREQKQTSLSAGVKSHYNLFSSVYQLTSASIAKLKAATDAKGMQKIPSSILEQLHAVLTSTLAAEQEDLFLQKLEKVIGRQAVVKYQRLLLDSSLFSDEPVSASLGCVVMEQKWDADNQGEIAIIHNPDLFHASYYRQSRGYRIRVRYLYP